MATDTTPTMITSQRPHWSTIASTVRAKAPSFHPKRIFESQTTAPQINSATTGIRQKSETTKPSGGAGTRSLCGVHVGSVVRGHRIGGFGRGCIPARSDGMDVVY